MANERIEAIWARAERHGLAPEHQLIECEVCQRLFTGCAACGLEDQHNCVGWW